MSREGNCWDNAVAESFFSTLEFEGPRTTTWRTTGDATPEMFTFIDGFYNAKRLHSRNGYRTPKEAESDWRALVAMDYDQRPSPRALGAA